MKRVSTIACVLVLLIPCLCPAETWEEFVKARQKAEAPAMIPKGGMKPNLIPKDVIIQRITQGQPVEFSSDAILFEYGLPAVRSECVPQVSVIADSLKDPRVADVPQFFVDGHTCSIGSNENNCRLSWERASEIVRRLAELGVPQSKMVARGFGKNHPTYSNDQEDSRRKNRRVVLSGGNNLTRTLSNDQMCKEWTPAGRAPGTAQGDAVPGTGKPSATSPTVPQTGSGVQKPGEGAKDIPKGFSPR